MQTQAYRKSRTSVYVDNETLNKIEKAILLEQKEMGKTSKADYIRRLVYEDLKKKGLLEVFN